MPSSDTQWKPGQSGNPNGRPPKAWTMSTLIEEALEEVEAQSGKSFKHLVAKRLAHMAVGGDIQAIKEINDRIDGKARQFTDITSGGDKITGIDASGLLDKVYGNKPAGSGEVSSDS